MSETGYDEWLAALASGEGYYLECDEGHGSLPPRRSCPHCGSPDLRETALPASGTVETYSVVHVAAPTFAGDAPYVSAICDFGGVRLTGVLRGVDADDATVGMTVEADAEARGDAEGDGGGSLVVFRPR
ncbi:Zn-ribbon domain-containing OB-fold protein [Halegenticoccus tardaugens]|uniref:Zn-ribbon domain-containing OB-fold protein n=1 Tax=Halegenticoccus tardaugens TaxID=2071624 RepID=UPI00100C326C|nr:OB-fold domain-containing protein [Halegenticoccus tardaugens]